MNANFLLAYVDNCLIIISDLYCILLMSESHSISAIDHVSKISKDKPNDVE